MAVGQGNDVMALKISIELALLTFTYQSPKQVRGLSHRVEGWTAQCFPAFEMPLEALTSWYSHLHALVSHIYRMCRL